MSVFGGILSFSCNICNKIQSDDTIVYTTWEHNNFICSSCYDSHPSKQLFESVTVDNFFNLMMNRPHCNSCKKQIITDTWMTCKPCLFDCCSRSTCNLSTCSICNKSLVTDTFSFS